MTENRLPDYLDHMQEAASDARSFVEGLSKEAFFTDKRTQQAVVMSLIVIGEAATKLMDRYPEFTAQCRCSVAKHAGNVESDCTWLLRYQPRRGLGNGANRSSGFAGATFPHSSRSR